MSDRGRRPASPSKSSVRTSRTSSPGLSAPPQPKGCSSGGAGKTVDITTAVAGATPDNGRTRRPRKGAERLYDKGKARLRKGAPAIRQGHEVDHNGATTPAANAGPETPRPGAIRVPGINGGRSDEEIRQSSFKSYQTQNGNHDGTTSAGLKTATIVMGDEPKSTTLDVVEREKIQMQAQREVEVKILSNIAHAEEDITEEERRKKRRRCYLLFCTSFVLVVAATIGVVMGVSGGGGSDRSSPLPMEPIKPPTLPPLPPLTTFSPTPPNPPTPPGEETDNNQTSLVAEVDNCFRARDITGFFGEPFLGTTVGAPRSLFDTCDVIERNGAGVFYSFIGDGKTKVASTCDGSFFDTQLSVYTADCNILQCVAGNDQMDCGNGDHSKLSWVAEKDVTYFINVHGHRRSQGRFTLLIEDLADNDECENVIEASSVSQFGSTRESTTESNVPPSCGRATQTAGGVWYQLDTLDVSSRFNVRIDTDGLTSFEPMISVFEGDSCQSLTCLDGNFGSVNFTATQGRKYYGLVHGIGTSQGDFRIAVNFEGLEDNRPRRYRGDRRDGFFNFIGTVPVDEEDCDTNSILPGEVKQGAINDAIFSSAQSCGRDVFVFGEGIWFNTIGDGGVLRASTCDTTTGVDTLISVFRGTCDELFCIDGNDKTAACSGDLSSISWHSEVDVMYFILIHAPGNRLRPFNFTVDSVSTARGPLVQTENGLCDDAVELPIDQDSVLGSFENAIIPTTFKNCALLESSNFPTVWYKITQGTGRSMTVSTCDRASTESIRLIVLAGNDCNQLTCVDEATTTTCGKRESITWKSTLGEQYFVLAQNTGPPLQSFISRQVPVGSFVLFAGETAVNDACTSPIGPLQPDGSLTVGSLWAATVDEVPSCSRSRIAVSPNRRGVWFTVLGTGETLSADLCSDLVGTSDVQVALYDGPCGSCVASQVLSACENGSNGKVTWTSTEGTLYYVMVHGEEPAETSNFALTVSVDNGENY